MYGKFLVDRIIKGRLSDTGKGEERRERTREPCADDEQMREGVSRSGFLEGGRGGGRRETRGKRKDRLTC